MILTTDHLETTVRLYPYRTSSICDSQFLPDHEKSVAVESVKEYEDSLVRIILPEGYSVIVDAAQLIMAIRKCTLE